MTIKERARKIACGNCNICKGEPKPCGGSQYQIYTNCLKIAKEQREIDIQRVLDLHCNKCIWVKSCTLRQSKKYTCQEIEKLKQVMKGE